LLLFSCGKKSKPTKTVEPTKTITAKPKPTTSVTPTKYFDNTLYRYAPVNGEDICNATVFATDCGIGNFYFTKKGNVFFTFFCMGQDSTSYLIGKYSITNTSIKCTFNKKYAYYEPTDKNVKVDVNSGKIKTTKSLPLELKKLNCEKFNYVVMDDNKKEKYVLQKSSGENTQRFFTDFKKIKTFEQF
jgi:hypothetical protein